MNKKLLDIREDGTPVVTDQGIVELLYSDKLDSLFEWENKKTKNEYLNMSKKLDTPALFQGKLDIKNRDWLLPKEYQNIDLTSYVLSRCKNNDETERAKLELDIIFSLNAESIFKQLIYLVDVWRAKNRVWGVGRGSSVSCFVLYAIGLNKINPLDYDLDYREFFKI